MKKRVAGKIVFSMLYVLLCFTGLAQAVIVDITVATDKPVYQLGEYVMVSITAYNPNPEPVTLHFGNPLRASYILDNTYDWASQRPTQPDMMGYVTIQSSESLTWNLVHDFLELQRYPLGIGLHTVVGKSLAVELVGIGTSTPVQFEVIPEPASLILLGFALPVIRVFSKRKYRLSK